MFRLRRWFIILTVLFAALPRLAPAISAENALFQSAANSLRNSLFERAEREFAQFTRQFPDSPRLAEAILFQAEARFRLNNYDGAVGLLAVHEAKAGKWADAYLFWLAESHFARGDYAQAAAEFAKLIKEFPASSRLLEACVKEASARSKLTPPDWPRVVASLQQTNNTFQSSARTNPASEWVPRGFLLLAEAFMGQTNYSAAEATLLPLGNRLMNPPLAWQRQYTICRAQLADGRLDSALLSTSNLLMFARSSEQPALHAQSAAFKATVLERLGRFDQAMDAYQTNLAPPAPAEFQRQALFKIAELSVAQNKIADAAQILERFLAQHPQAATADLAWLTLGELRLRQLAALLGTNSLSLNNLNLAGTNAAAATNVLQKARSAFETLSGQFPKSPRFGLAQLDLGWCLWLEGNFPESRNAFQLAVNRLPLSPDLARAHFKLADTQFRLRDYAGAVTNYSAVIQKFTAFPDVETNFFEPALYQIVQAGLAAGDLPAVTNALQTILTWYPNGFHTDRAALITGQELARQGNPAMARQILSSFASQAPNAALIPEVKLAIARAYEQAGNWTLALQQYEAWLATFTNHPARPRAEYCRALAYYHAGDETNAWNCFTNFVALYPTNDFAPSAQWWVADHYYQAGDFNQAERDFQILYRNWPASELACPAWLMAGNAAAMRQSWENAKDYFVKLYDHTNCPADIRLQALFAYGDYWVSRSPTNNLADLAEAIGIFTRISQENPTNQIGLRALGRKADALLQAGQFEEAAKAYRQLTNSPFADLRTRSQALIGLALVLEKQADEKPPAERAELLKLALDSYLDVLFPEKMLRDGEQADPFWTKKAGQEAIHLAEALGDWPRVVSIAKALCRLLPVLCPSLESKILKAQENLRAQN